MSAIHPSSPRGLFGALHCSQSRWFGSLLGELVEVHADPFQLQGNFSDSVDHDDVFFQSRFTDKVTLVELGRGNLAFDALKFFVGDEELELFRSFSRHWRCLLSVVVSKGIKGGTPCKSHIVLHEVCTHVGILLLLRYIDHNMINDKSNTLYLRSSVLLLLHSWICSKSLSVASLPILVGSGIKL